MSLKIRWRACGEEMRDRRGTLFIDGTACRSQIVVQYSYRWRRYAVGFCGHTRAEGLATVEQAKAVAEEHASAWLAEHEAEVTARAAAQQAAEEERAAWHRRCVEAVNGLRALGVPCDGSYDVGLPVEAVELVIARLRAASGASGD